MGSDWSKTHVLPEYKTQKKHVLVLCATLPLYHEANEEALPVHYTVLKDFGHLRALEKCRQHWPGAFAFFVSLMFSNACSQASLFVTCKYICHRKHGQPEYRKAVVYCLIQYYTQPFHCSLHIHTIVCVGHYFLDGMVYKGAAKVPTGPGCSKAA